MFPLFDWIKNFDRNDFKRKFKFFKEEWLPIVIGGVAALLILIFVIGSISNASKRKAAEEAALLAAEEKNQQERAALDAQVEDLLQQANTAAAQYDYETALSILAPVTKHTNQYPKLKQAISDYETAQEALVAWSDPAQVPNLSFQMLIADPDAAFNDEQYGKALNTRYVTTEEFSKILVQLYENDYILVSLKDLYTTQGSEDGAVAYMADTIYLPAGKKPLIITQTNVNYDQYLIDKNKDGDLSDGRGFASKLLIQDGKPVNEMVDSNGYTTVGEYDLIPILESFVRSHPDFSYRGAKAVIAVTGHEGLFGYRQVEQASATAQWLKDNGYELACYTYGNEAYGRQELPAIRADLLNWNESIAPVLGNVDILVYAQRSDLADYAGGKFEILLQQGFHYYLGFCTDGAPWSKATTQYIRQGQIMVAGATMTHNSDWFSGMFDPSSVLDSSRGTVPSWSW